MKDFLKISALALLIISMASVSLALPKVGALAGYRSNKATADNGVNYNATPGYQVGGLLFFTFTDLFAFRTGLIYTARDVNASFGTLELKSKIAYLDVPVNAQISLPLTGLYAFGGLKLGFKSSSSCEVLNATLTCVSNSVAPLNILFNIGPGYELVNLGVMKLAVEGEYEMGLTNASTSSDKVTTNGFAVNAVLVFGI